MNDATPENLATLQAALHIATNRSAALSLSEKPAFIGRCLLATFNGEPLPESNTSAQVDTSDVQELAAILTAAIKAARGQEGWPLLALGRELTRVPPTPAAQTGDAALIEAAKARLAQNQAAIDTAVERLSNATTGAEKKAAAAERAQLEAESAEEQAAETAAAINAALARGGASETTKYDDPMAIFEALEGDATQLLRGSWVRDAPEGTVLGKRGELPPEALITVAELREIYAKSEVYFKSLPFIAISHYWRTKTHPDPKGETLALVAKSLKAQWHHFESSGVTNVGIFFE